ncbi:MAG: hypothetical protein EBX50_17275, partial [Chitinophagia bacterium]|nr:hypothetical protein [Chitinophagia bacterium]
YKSLIGPVGNVADSQSIYNSLAPFTLNCSTGNNGMNCSTTYNTKGPISYNLGPTTGSFSTTYNFGNNGVLVVGNWKLFQDTAGNLQIINSGTTGTLVSKNINLDGDVNAVGNISSKGIINANILKASGNIEGNSVFSNYIKSNGNIDANGRIHSDKWIEATGDINAGGKIDANGYIHSQDNVWGRNSVETDGKMRIGGTTLSNGAYFDIFPQGGNTYHHGNLQNNK